MKINTLILGIPWLMMLTGCSMFQTAQDRAQQSLAKVTVASADQKQTFVNDYLGMESIGVIVMSPSNSSVQAHINIAYKLLRTKADYRAARLELGKALYKDPDNITALALYNQISADLPIVALNNGINLKADKTYYLAKVGDNLEQVSRRFYGTSTLFPMLMRVNRLTGSRLQGGERLWIPAKLTRKRNLESAQASISSLAQQDPAQQRSERRAPPPRASQIESEPTKKIASKPAAEQLPIEASTHGATTATHKTKAISQPDMPSQSLPEMPIKRELSKEEIKGLSEYRKGAHKRAYSLLTSATNLSSQGQKTLNKLIEQLLEQPYAQGLDFYQKQMLEQAILKFDEVLAVNPNYSQARLYRTRCQQLLERLQSIE